MKILHISDSQNKELMGTVKELCKRRARPTTTPIYFKKLQLIKDALTK